MSEKEKQNQGKDEAKDKVDNKTRFQKFTAEGIRVTRNVGTITRAETGEKISYDSIKINDFTDPKGKAIKISDELLQIIKEAWEQRESEKSEVEA